MWGTMCWIQKTTPALPALTKMDVIDKAPISVVKSVWSRLDCPPFVLADIWVTASFLLSSTSSFLPLNPPSLSRGGKLQGMQSMQSPCPGSRLAGASYPVIYSGQAHPCFVSCVKACLSGSWWLIELARSELRCTRLVGDVHMNDFVWWWWLLWHNQGMYWRKWCVLPQCFCHNHLGLKRW